MRKFALMCGVVAALLSAPSAQAIGLSDVGVSTGLYGNYIFRGARLDPTGLASDAYATFNLSNRLTVTPYIWNWTAAEGSKNSLETDYSAWLSWVPPIFNDKVTLTGGYIYYDIQRAAFGLDTQEAFLGIDVDCIGSPALYIYQDFDTFVGTYINASAGHSWDLGESGWTLDVSGAIGFDVGRLGASGNGGFQDAVVSTGFSYDLGGGLSFGPAIDWWFPSNAIDPTTDVCRPVGSLGFSWSKEY